MWCSFPIALYAIRWFAWPTAQDSAANRDAISGGFGKRAQRVLYFDGAPGYSQRRAAFRHVVAFRCKCRFAKRTSLLPGTRPQRPMQQIHGLRPFFQHNACGAFRASAAKIRVHHMPPKVIAKSGATLSRQELNRAGAGLVRTCVCALPTLRFWRLHSIQWIT